MNKSELLDFVRDLPDNLFQPLPTGSVLLPVIGPEVLKFTAGAVGIIEASRYEQTILWGDYSKKDGFNWVSVNEGYGATVGKVGDLPICISISRANINGRKILFYETTSRVVDHDIVEQWFDTNFPSVPRTDAVNAHNVLSRGF